VNKDLYIMAANTGLRHCAACGHFIMIFAVFDPWPPLDFF